MYTYEKWNIIIIIMDIMEYGMILILYFYGDLMVYTYLNHGEFTWIVGMKENPTKKWWIPSYIYI